MTVSLKEKAYDIIKDKIIECEYEPNSIITEKQLCDELQVSRTPIRDALGRLEQEQLVIIIPKKGVLISPVTINDINMIFETRLLLEPYIISKYGTRIDEQTQIKLNNLLIDYNYNISDINTAFNIDDEFHRILIELSRNKYMIQMYSSIYAQNSRLRIMSGGLSDNRLRDTHNEHCAIANYIVKMNYDEAAQAMRDHLINAKDAAFKAILDKNILLD